MKQYVNVFIGATVGIGIPATRILIIGFRMEQSSLSSIPVYVVPDPKVGCLVLFRFLLNW